MRETYVAVIRLAACACTCDNGALAKALLETSRASSTAVLDVESEALLKRSARTGEAPSAGVREFHENGLSN
jgi:hypothetical protein